MTKSLDGIRKLNPADIKKYRKIVLNYIGEKDSAEVDEQKNSSQAVPSLRRVDGVNLSKINRFEAKRGLNFKKSSAEGSLPSIFPTRRPVEPTGALSRTKDISEKLREREAERLKEAIKRQEEERKRIKEEEREYRMKKEQLEKDRREQREKLEWEKIRLDGERVRREEIKLKEKEEAAKQVAREKKKIKRQKAWRKVKRNLNFKLNDFFSEIKQNIIYLILLLMLFLVIAYMVFCLAVLRFKIDDNIIGQAANYLPVPAVITSQGVVSYNEFKKIEKKNYLNLSLAEKKNYLAKWVVLRDLKEKYGLPVQAADDDLAIKYVLSEDFNQVGLSRINKINKLLKGQSQIEPFGKYADEYNDGVFYSRLSATEKFGPTVLKLAVGQISNIISRPDGYYIIERIDDETGGQLGFKYIFIRAQTLDQYVYKSLERIRVFILAN